MSTSSIGPSPQSTPAPFVTAEGARDGQGKNSLERFDALFASQRAGEEPQGPHDESEADVTERRAADGASEASFAGLGTKAVVVASAEGQSDPANLSLLGRAMRRLHEITSTITGHAPSNEPPQAPAAQTAPEAGDASEPAAGESEGFVWAHELPDAPQVDFEAAEPRSDEQGEFLQTQRAEPQALRSNEQDHAADGAGDAPRTSERLVADEQKDSEAISANQAHTRDSAPARNAPSPARAGASRLAQGAAQPSRTTADKPADASASTPQQKASADRSLAVQAQERVARQEAVVAAEEQVAQVDDVEDVLDALQTRDVDNAQAASDREEQRVNRHASEEASSASARGPTDFAPTTNVPAVPAESSTSPGSDESRPHAQADARSGAGTQAEAPLFEARAERTQVSAVASAPKAAPQASDDGEDETLQVSATAQRSTAAAEHLRADAAQKVDDEHDERDDRDAQQARAADSVVLLDPLSWQTANAWLQTAPASEVASASERRTDAIATEQSLSQDPLAGLAWQGLMTGIGKPPVDATETTAPGTDAISSSQAPSAGTAASPELVAALAAESDESVQVNPLTLASARPTPAQDEVEEESAVGETTSEASATRAPTSLSQADGSLRAQHTASSAPIDAPAPRNVVPHEVGEELAHAVGLGNRNIRLQVAPPGVGQLNIDVRVVEGRVQMRVAGEAENLAATLRQQGESLQSSLEARGLTLDSLDFRGNQTNEQQSQSQSPGEQSARREEREDARESQAFERLLGPGGRFVAQAAAPTAMRRGSEQVIYVRV